METLSALLALGEGSLITVGAVMWSFNTLRPRQDGRHFPDDIFKCIFLNENARISLKKSLKFVPKVRINNIPALVQIMAWRRTGDKPLSEPMVVSLLTHICVTRPQWVNIHYVGSLNKLWNKSSSLRWVETLWRSCDVTIMMRQYSLEHHIRINGNRCQIFHFP